MEKKPIKKDHIKEFGGWNAPEAPQGKVRDVPGTPRTFGRFVGKFQLKGQNVRGTDGTYDRTDGTCPWGRRDTHQGVSRQNSLCLLVFFFLPHSQTDPGNPSE